MALTANAPQLTLGPLLYNWPAAKARDFYARVADEMAVERVYIGEVVCAKRQPLQAAYLPAAIERLQAAGKEVVLSTLALVMTERELTQLRETIAETDLLIEANDLAALALLEGRRFVCGPTVNVYNEGTLALVESLGAVTVAVPFELARSTLAVLASQAQVPLEVQVFGRLPLAISARCYHARAHQLHKDNCQFVCERHGNGMAVQTLDHQPFLAVNGTQVQSHAYANLLQELADLRAIGVSFFRISPQDMDMTQVVAAFRGVLAGNLSPAEGLARLRTVTGDATYANGFYHATAGNLCLQPRT